MKKAFFTLFLCLPFALQAQSDLFKLQRDLIQTKIDSIEISDYLLNEPKDKNFNSKFKVLEFWATWCRPCLKAVPHLNKLQDKFKDSNIVFMSFTYESPKNTEKTLKNVKFLTIVVSDTTKTIHKKLRIEHNGLMPLPRTVLIDNENKIIWYGDPRKLTAKLIQRFLRKEPLVK